MSMAIALLLGHVLMLAAVWFNHRNTPAAEGFAEGDGSEGALLVVVPARDEAANIGACVRSLRSTRYPRVKIRVVDDHSSDGTAALARSAADGDPRVEVIAADELPPGWLGKSHALHCGARGATDEWLLFLDADLRVSCDCLGRAVAAASSSGADLFTMLPRSEMRTFWERVAQSLVMQLVVAWLPAGQINDPRHRRAGAIGPFMLFRRTAWERIGGHEAVRSEVVEDLRLAERIKQHGLRLVFMRGIDLATVRMYDSLGAIVRGWSKNFHVALGRAVWATPLVAAGLLFLFAGPLVVPLAAAATGAWGAAAVAAAAAAVALWARIELDRRYGVSARGAWLMSLGAAVVAWILIDSSLRALTGRSIAWKGRAVG